MALEINILIFLGEHECFTNLSGSILKLEMSIFNPNTIKVVHNTCSAHIAHIKVRQCPVYQPGTVLGEINDGNDWESIECML